MYGLVDPRSGKIRYIGQTKAPRRRFQQHKRFDCKSNPKLEAWLKKLSRECVEPIVETLGVYTTQEEADQNERDWICDLRQAFGRKVVLNIADGGNGPDYKGRVFTEEHRRKLSEAAKRRPSPPKEEMSRRAKKGWATISDEGLQRIREAVGNAARNRSEEAEARRIETRRKNGWNRRDRRS